MSEFEFLYVLISIVIGFAHVRLLSGLGHAWYIAITLVFWSFGIRQTLGFPG